MTEATHTSMCLEAIFEERGIDPHEFTKTFTCSHHVRAILEGESQVLDFYFAHDVTRTLGLSEGETSKLARAIYDDVKELFSKRKSS